MATQDRLTGTLLSIIAAAAGGYLVWRFTQGAGANNGPRVRIDNAEFIVVGEGGVDIAVTVTGEVVNTGTEEGLYEIEMMLKGSDGVSRSYPLPGSILVDDTPLLPSGPPLQFFGSYNLLGLGDVRPDTYVFEVWARELLTDLVYVAQSEFAVTVP